MVESFLLAIRGEGWGKRQTNQDRLVDLIRLRELEEELFRRLLEVGSIEYHDAIGTAAWLQSGGA
jgi:hypothetical protein